MEEVLIITGACGVGKSTIAKEWARIKDGATIDCDYLAEWIHKKDFPHWTIEEEKFVAKLASKIAIEYLNYGMSTSIENVWSPIGIEMVKREIQSSLKVRVKAIWLVCDLAENHKRDQQRKLENQMKERVDIVDAELRDYDWPEYLNQIDTRNLNIDQTIKLIENIVS